MAVLVMELDMAAVEQAMEVHMAVEQVMEVHMVTDMEQAMEAHMEMDMELAIEVLTVVQAMAMVTINRAAA